MKTVRRRCIALSLGCLALVAGRAGSASAGFVQAVSPSWAAGLNTTAQTWTTMAPTALVPTAITAQAPTGLSENPNGTAGWYDGNSPADGAIVVGSDVYSFAPTPFINPTATIPGFAISGNSLKVLAEVQSYGDMIDPTDLTATYFDGSGAHTVLASSLPGYEYSEIYNDGGQPFEIGPGMFVTVYTVDHQWEFTLPSDVANFDLNWGWGASFDRDSGAGRLYAIRAGAGHTGLDDVGRGAAAGDGTPFEKTPGMTAEIGRAHRAFCGDCRNLLSRGRFSSIRGGSQCFVGFAVSGFAC